MEILEILQGEIIKTVYNHNYKIYFYKRRIKKRLNLAKSRVNTQSQLWYCKRHFFFRRSFHNFLTLMQNVLQFLFPVT